MTSIFNINNKSDDFIKLAYLYELVTSNVYNNQTEEELLKELKEVKKFLLDQANLYTFEGIFRDIHASIIMEELEEFNMNVLLGYVDFFFMDIPDNLNQKIRTFDINSIEDNKQLEQYKTIKLELMKCILTEKYRNLESLRLHKYICDILFDRSKEPVFPGKLRHFHPPTAIEIKENGIEYYYPLVGKINMEELTDLFSYSELLHITAVLLSKKYRTHTFTTDIHIDKMIELICLSLEEVKFDPRCVLTLFGIKIILNIEGEEHTYNINPHKYQEYEQLALAATNEGLSLCDINGLKKPIGILHEEYVITQLTSTFFTDIEVHRTKEEACTELETISGVDITIDNIEEDLVLYYGIRNGLAKYIPMTCKELYDVFLKYNEFYNPYTVYHNDDNPFEWELFSLKTIKRLSNKILSKHITIGYCKLLINIINTIMTNKLDKSDKNESLKMYLYNVDTLVPIGIYNKIKLLSPEIRQANIITILSNCSNNIKLAISNALIKMFNIGIYIANWNDTIIGIDPLAIAIQRQHDFVDVKDPIWSGETRFRIFNELLRISNDINKIPMASRENIDTRITNLSLSEKHKHNSKDSFLNRLITTLEEINQDEKINIGGLFKELKIIRYYNSQFHIDYTSDVSSIDGHLKILITCNDLAIDSTLRLGANWLITTADFYHKEILGSNITTVQIDEMNEADL